MTISLLQYISDVKNEIQFWENEINFYLNEIKLLHIRLDSLLERDINDYQENKLRNFKTLNSNLNSNALEIIQEIEEFDNSLIGKDNDKEMNEETFEKYHYFKEKLDNLTNDYMEFKDELLRFTISTFA
ncbi:MULTISPECIES: hypothetical protein [unclassified Flammeovirga]|uniref:hypothetical protein n=1 Tax=unclassified Flammeovirga TaxID=2637820 RepID=UPI0005C5FEF8|nr:MULTISPECIES: hypothetical protein [unclassified Flammeovirga]MBD0404433.1 hypothetical protein [Flammeovirga sp. EKP202]